MSLTDLKQNLIETLNANKTEILASAYPEDELEEYIENKLPIYNNDLIKCLQGNHDLGYLQDYDLIGRKGINVFKIIQISIYEELNQLAFKWLEQAMEEEMR